MRSIGLVYKRTEGSHEIWDKPDNSLLRPVVIVTNKKDVPDFHVRTTLKNLGLTQEDLEDWLNE